MGGGEGGKERVVIRIGHVVYRELLAEGSCMRECSSVDAVYLKRLLILTAGVVQHFQHRGAPGHVIILSGTIINCVNRCEVDQMKKGEMGWACGMKGAKKNAYRISMVETWREIAWRT